MTDKEKTHVGFKGTWKFIGWLLGAIIIIFEMIMNWIPAETITSAMIVKVLLIAAVAFIGVPAMAYIADILWALAHKMKELIMEED